MVRKWLGAWRIRQSSSDSKPSKVYKGYKLEEEDTGKEFEYDGTQWNEKVQKSSTPIAGNLAFAHTTTGYNNGSYSGEIANVPSTYLFNFTIQARTYRTFGSSGSGSISPNGNYNKLDYTTSHYGQKIMNSLQLTLNYTDGTSISLNPNGTNQTIDLDYNKTVSNVTGSGTAPAVYSRNSYTAGRNFNFTFHGFNNSLTKALADGVPFLSPSKMNPEYTMNFGATNISEINFVPTGTAQNFEIYADDTLVRTVNETGYIRFNAINCSSIRVKCIDTTPKTLGFSTFQYHAVSLNDFFTHGHKAIDASDVSLNSTATE